jgi:hypothetical protein
MCVDHDGAHERSEQTQRKPCINRDKSARGIIAINLLCLLAARADSVFVGFPPILVAAFATFAAAAAGGAADFTFSCATFVNSFFSICIRANSITNWINIILSIDTISTTTTASKSDFLANLLTSDNITITITITITISITVTTSTTTTTVTTPSTITQQAW